MRYQESILDDQDRSLNYENDFENILDTISSNMQMAAQIPFSKRTIDYGSALSTHKRRNIGSASQSGDKNIDSSFFSNNSSGHSFSRDHTEQLPPLVVTRGPSHEELGLLEALNNPDYLRAVRGLIELTEPSYDYSIAHCDAQAKVDDDCLLFSSIMERFEVAEKALMEYTTRAKDLFHLGTFRNEKEDLELIEIRREEIFKRAVELYEEPPLPYSTPSSQVREELLLAKQEIEAHASAIDQLEKTAIENERICEQLKRELRNLERRAIEANRPFESEKLKIEELQSNIACIENKLELLQGEIDSVTSEISQLESQDEAVHPAFTSLLESLDQLSEYSPETDNSSPLIDDLANKLLRRIDNIVTTCKELIQFPKKGSKSELQNAIASHVAGLPAEKIQAAGLQPASTVAAFILTCLTQDPHPDGTLLDSIKNSVYQKLGADSDMIESAVYNLASRDLIKIDHSSHRIYLPQDDSAEN